MTETAILGAINDALSDEKRNNMNMLSHAFRNRIKSPLDTAIWWVEYIASMNGTTFMKSPAVWMTSWSYYLLDVYAIIILILFMVIYSFLICIRFCFSRLRLKRKTKVE